MSLYKNKKVVVTGGSGFVGTNLALELLNRGANVRTSTHKRPMQIQDDRIELLENIDLTKFDDAMTLIDGADIVIHCAGDILHPSTVSTDFQVGLSHINIITNILEASYKHKVKHFLELNSSTVYPHRDYAVSEDEFWLEEPFLSYYGYGWMRRYREKVIEHTSHLCDMHIGIARGTAPFGPYDNFDLKTCHVVPALIKRCLSGENPFVVWGSSDVTRDFMYVKDMIKGCLLVLEKGESMKPYNVGSGTGVTIGELVEAVVKSSDNNPTIEWDNSKPTTIPYKVSSIERLQNELDFKPDYTFEQGIKETMDWYNEQE